MNILQFKLDGVLGEAPTNYEEVSIELKIEKTKTRKAGEEGLFEICIKKDIFLITDDIKAIRKMLAEITSLPDYRTARKVKICVNLAQFFMQQNDFQKADIYFHLFSLSSFL